MASRTNKDIQALRGIAILLVMIQHFRGRLPTSDGYNKVFEYFAFWGGVDLFFVISGYVICTSLMSNTGIASGTRLTFGEFGAFLRRRFVRLTPAAWFWIAACSSLLVVAPETSNGELSPPAFLAHLSALTATANLYWSHCLTASAAGCINPDVIGVYWSLSLEEQFYLALGIGLVILPLDRLLVLLLAVAAVFTALALTIGDIRPFSLLWVLRPQGLILGIALAVTGRHGFLDPIRSIPRAARRVLILGAAALICFVAVATPLRLSIPAMAVISTVMVGLATPDGSISTGLGRALVWVGDRSYSIYLCHLFVFHLIRKAIDASIGPTAYLSPPDHMTFMWLAAACGAAFVVGHLSYRYIERPRWLAGRVSA
jgi:peptidoglycan/LPS O-acetylase OafA/YrhL